MIGLMFGVPAGAVGAMTVQQALTRGFRFGLVTGIGSSMADCLYACVGAFGLTIISDFLTEYQIPINCVGAAFIIVLGLLMLLKRRRETKVKAEGANAIMLFFSSFIVGITNPAAILTFLFAFTNFGIEGTLNLSEGGMLVLGVFAGTMVWWITLSALASCFKKKMKERGIKILNLIFGIILIGFGIFVLIRTFL